jgi:hypothetical protein
MDKRKYLDFYFSEANIKNTLELLEMSDACLWLLDLDYKLLAFNKIYVEHMVAYTNVKPVIGNNDFIIKYFPDGFSDKVKEMYSSALSGNIVKSIEKGYNTDGSPADIVMIFKPVKNDSDVVTGIACARRDISEYVSLKEKLGDRDATINRMNWQQSHLMRGPLSTAMGIVNALKGMCDSDLIDKNEGRFLIEGLNDKLKELDTVIRTIAKNSEE